VKSYSRLLVPLDGSTVAEVVLPFARQLAVRLGLEINILHVCSSDDSEFSSMHRRYVQWIGDSIKQQSITESSTIETRSHIVTGHSAEGILDFAEENRMDLILMATHGYSGIRRWALGGVADKVLRMSKVPIWLIRAGQAQQVDYDKWSKITALVLLDGSKYSEHILPHVEMMSKQRGAEIIDVILIRVCEPPEISADYPASMRLSWEENVKRVTDLMKQSSRKYLEGIEKRLTDSGLKVRSEVLMGKPADEIIKYATGIPDGLIAMTTRGHSGISRWAYGSVADRILTGASNPVLLIRPQE